MSFHALRRARRDRQSIFTKLTLTNTKAHEIVPGEAGGDPAGAKVGQNTASSHGRRSRRRDPAPGQVLQEE